MDWEQWFTASRRELRKRYRLDRADAVQYFNGQLMDAASLLNKQFPWRSNRTPYRVLIAEVMLQQTQADRVVPLYRRFLKEFPSFSRLASAPQSKVIQCWQGLGYNRRALFLHSLAKEIASSNHGRLPQDPERLRALPGIGAYTSKSILVFAHNQRHVFIETNIRSMFIYYFTGMKGVYTDQKLLPLIERALRRQSPRDWYEALMDVGSVLKQQVPGLNVYSAGYKKQSRFEGSFRQKRGVVLKALTNNSSLCESLLQRSLTISEKELDAVLGSLVNDGFVKRTMGTVVLL